MSAQFCKISAFEANIIPDSKDENEFYTIRKEYEIPFDLEGLDVNLDAFVMNELTDELISLDYSLNPCAILVVSGYRLAFISTYEIIVDEYEIPFAKVTIDESGNPNVINLLEGI